MSIDSEFSSVAAIKLKGVSGMKYYQDVERCGVCAVCLLVILALFFAPVPGRAAEQYCFEQMWPTTAVAWSFAQPMDIAVDTANSVYVADRGTGCIQKLTTSGELLSSDDYLQFGTPVAVVAFGTSTIHIYVAFTSNCIVKMTSAGEYIAQWGSSGTGEGQFRGIEGIAVDSSSNVYVADSGNNRIQKFTPDGEFVTAWGSVGHANGEFNTPAAVAVDRSGTVYVADSGNDRIQKFTPTGDFLGKWGTSGTASGEFVSPKGIAVDGNGDVYVADAGNNRIQKLNSLGVVIDMWGESSRLKDPNGIAVDGRNNVYVADTDNSRIRIYTSSGSNVATWSASGSRNGQFVNPASVAMDGRGNIYVVDSGNDRIQKFTASGAFITEWGSSGTGDGHFSTPLGIAVDGDGKVYVADTSNHRIQIFSSSGVFIDKWGIPGMGYSEFDLPSAVAVDSSGNVYVADSNNHRIQKFSPEGEFLSKIGLYGSGPGQVNMPSDVEVDSDGNVYVADMVNNRIQKFSAAGEFLAELGETVRFNKPYGVAVDDKNDVFVADTFNSRICKFSSEGAFLCSWGTEGIDMGELNHPTSIVVADNGLVYVADSENHRVQVFSRTRNLYYPHIASDSFWETEVAVINTSPYHVLNGTLEAFDGSGEPISGALFITVPAHGRRQFTISEEFPNPENIRYLILKSGSDFVTGYTKFYGSGLYRVAIPATSDISTGDIPLPHIASNDTWWTGVALVNTDGNEKTLTIAFDNGESRTLILGPHEHKAFTIESLFQDGSQPSLHAGVIKEASGVIGLELFGNAESLEGVPLTSTMSTSLYYPHAANDSTWWTGIVVYNPFDSACTLSITPYSDSGTMLSSTDEILNSQQQFVGTIDDMDFPDDTAWIRITATTPITGFELLGTTDNEQLGGVVGMEEGRYEGTFAKIEKAGWTSIALVNTDKYPTEVTLTAYDNEGEVYATSTILLNGYAKIEDTVEDFFAGQALGSATYVGYNSDKKVVGVQLNGSDDDTMLDGLPGM